MKKLFNLKTLILIIFALSVMALTACEKPADKTTDTLPDFSFTLNDGESEIEVTDELMNGIALHPYSTQKKSGETVYYKGFKVSDMLGKIANLTDKDNIDSLRFVGTDGFGSDKPALPRENFANAYIVILSSATEDGEYTALTDDGPARLYDATAGSGVKSISQIDYADVNRELFVINDGDDTYKIGLSELESLELEEFSVIKKNNETEYYKGYVIADLLESLSDFDTESVVSLKIVGRDGYGEDITKTSPYLKANLEQSYLAIEISADGEEYESLDDEDGPIRAYDLTPDSESKSIRQVATITVNR